MLNITSPGQDRLFFFNIIKWFGGGGYFIILFILSIYDFNQKRNRFRDFKKLQKQTTEKNLQMKDKVGIFKDTCNHYLKHFF